jgi:hypothetical protein
MYIGLRVKCPLFLSDPNQTWMFSTYFQKILRYRISWKSIPWEPSCSMSTDGRTDMTKLIFTFRNFTNAPEDHSISPYLRFASQFKAQKCWQFSAKYRNRVGVLFTPASESGCPLIIPSNQAVNVAVRHGRRYVYGTRGFSSFPIVVTGSGVHPSSYSVGTGILSRE